MMEQQFFALDLEATTSRMKRLQFEDRVVTLLNELWDQICDKTTERRTLEISSDEEGMKVTLGGLRVPTFYFMNEKKFSWQLKYMLKCQVQSQHWLKIKMRELFVDDWCDEILRLGAGRETERSP